jgi:hypothetical protein
VGYLKSLIKPIVPKSLLRAHRSYNLARMHRRAQRMTAEEVFTDIYTSNRWGGAPGTFCSGTGSTTTSIVAPYVECIRDRLSKLDARLLTVVDLGCGDFSVGRQLSDDCKRYVGVDIVKGLVQHNNAVFGTGRISFQRLDIIEDSLPDGDICFLRQVLQHLTNAQILKILAKLNRYKWTFITEHQPSPSRLGQRNLDKPHGDDIRILRCSGVFLDYPPFGVPRERLELVLEVPGHAEGPDPGVIRTYLLRPETLAAPSHQPRSVGNPLR